MCTNFSLHFSVSSPRYLWQQLQLVRPAPQPVLLSCWTSYFALFWSLFVEHGYKLVQQMGAVLWYCDASVFNYVRRFGDNLSLPSSWTTIPLKMGPIGCPETSVRNYRCTPSNNAEERSSQIHLGGSLTSHQSVHRWESHRLTRLVSFLISRCCVIYIF